MFVAHAGNTMRNARYSFREAEPVRTIDQIRAERREDAAALQRQWAVDLEMRRKAAIEMDARRATEAILKGRAAARAFNGVNEEALRFQHICARFCKVFDLSMHEVKSDRRSRNIAMCRQSIMYWAIRRTSYSFPQIGRFLGNRDHTTVLHGVRVYPEKRAKMGRHLRAAR